MNPLGSFLGGASPVSFGAGSSPSASSAASSKSGDAQGAILGAVSFGDFNAGGTSWKTYAVIGGIAVLGLALWLKKH